VGTTGPRGIVKMSESVEAAGRSDELGAVDYLLHRGEANPRTRSGIMAVELLDSSPDWDRFRTRFENASRRVLRLRQKVVVPTLPTAAPRWVIDPDFNLDFHVRRMRVPEPGTLREVFDLAELILQSPLTYPGHCGPPHWSRACRAARLRPCCMSAMRSPTVSAV
jgi:diacylglycerol O-acyltransferase